MIQRGARAGLHTFVGGWGGGEGGGGAEISAPLQCYDYVHGIVLPPRSGLLLRPCRTELIQVMSYRHETSISQVLTPLADFTLQPALSGPRLPS